MDFLKKKAWGIITARGGSKSIPLKNIVPVCGKPLLEYSLDSAMRAVTLDKVFCSTDNFQIADVAVQSGAEILERPEHLCGDLVASIDVVVEAVQSLGKQKGKLPEIIALIQPTSIFLTQSHIDKAINALLDDNQAQSVQTVIRIPHHFHAYNQRVIEENTRYCSFAFPEYRKPPFNKQTKPAFYAIGNFTASRTETLLSQRIFFAEPSIAVAIPDFYGYDLDTAEDIQLAEILLKNNIINCE